MLDSHSATFTRSDEGYFGCGYAASFNRQPKACAWVESFVSAPNTRRARLRLAVKREVVRQAELVRNVETMPLAGEADTNPKRKRGGKARFIRVFGGIAGSGRMCAVVGFHPEGITAISRGLSVRDTPGRVPTKNFAS